jgi:hypothetical protein
VLVSARDFHFWTQTHFPVDPYRVFYGFDFPVRSVISKVRISAQRVSSTLPLLNNFGSWTMNAIRSELFHSTLYSHSVYHFVIRNSQHIFKFRRGAMQSALPATVPWLFSCPVPHPSPLPCRNLPVYSSQFPVVVKAMRLARACGTQGTPH